MMLGIGPIFSVLLGIRHLALIMMEFHPMTRQRITTLINWRMIMETLEEEFKNERAQNENTE